MRTERYAVVVKIRMQVTTFVDNPKSINQGLAILIDLQDHPQKDEIQEDWFYNAEDNTFSPEGEVHYPEVITPQPTQLDRIEEQLAARNDALRQEGADALTLELLERGIL